MRIARVGLVAAGSIALALGAAGCQNDGDDATGMNDAGSTELVAMNTSCPIMGSDVDPSTAVAYKDGYVAFCCNGCAGKWDKLSDDEKAEKLLAAK